MSYEFNPSDGHDFSSDQFVEQLGNLFEREHRLHTPPEPEPNNEYITNRASIRSLSNYSFDAFDDSHVTPPEPTLQEKIVWRDSAVKLMKSFERTQVKTKRSRLNFGTEFHIAVSFYFNGSLYIPESQQQEAEIGATNRANLYQYLQHKGMVLVDDTGRDDYYGQRTTKDKGYLMLPAEIEHEDYFVLEDAVRKVFPFTYDEIVLERMIQRQVGQAETPLEEHASDPKSMMELVDLLSMDERFTDLFEVARKISQARREKPRASLDDDIATPAEKPESKQVVGKDFLDRFPSIEISEELDFSQDKKFINPKDIGSMIRFINIESL